MGGRQPVLTEGEGRDGERQDKEESEFCCASIISHFLFFGNVGIGKEIEVQSGYQGAGHGSKCSEEQGRIN